jgi:drug/metabolite transporter (DMT)-like permease
MMRSRENLGMVVGLAGVIMFAGTLPAMRLAVAAIDPLFVTAGRAALAGMVALVLLAVMRRPLPPRHLWGDLAAIAVCLVLGFPILSAFAMVTVPAAHGSVLLGILPLATAVAAVAFAKERPGGVFWVASTVGAGLVVIFALRNGGTGPLLGGDFLLFASIVVVAVGYALAGRLSLAVPGWEVISWAAAISLPISIPAAIALFPADITSIPRTAWLGFIYVALVSQLFAFFAWNAGLALGGIARVGQVQLVQTFLSIGLAHMVNGEAINAEMALFATAVVVTIVVGRNAHVARQHHPAPTS